MLEKTIQLFFCHLLGDYVLQTPYIAETKRKNSYHMFVHCSLYCFPFYLCFGLDQRILLVFLSHFLIDTLKARYDRISVIMDQTLHYMVLPYICCRFHIIWCQSPFRNILTSHFKESCFMIIPTTRKEAKNNNLYRQKPGKQF